MNRAYTIQTRVDNDLYETLKRVCEMRGQTIAEYIRNALRDALANEPEMYKRLLKIQKGKK